MNMELNDSLRTLAGIAGSDKITKEVKDAAERQILEIIKYIGHNVELQKRVLEDYKLQNSKIAI